MTQIIDTTILSLPQIKNLLGDIVARAEAEGVVDRERADSIREALDYPEIIDLHPDIALRLWLLISRSIENGSTMLQKQARRFREGYLRELQRPEEIGAAPSDDDLARDYADIIETLWELKLAARASAASVENVYLKFFLRALEQHIEKLATQKIEDHGSIRRWIGNAHTRLELLGKIVADEDDHGLRDILAKLARTIGTYAESQGGQYEYLRDLIAPFIGMERFDMKKCQTLAEVLVRFGELTRPLLPDWHFGDEEVWTRVGAPLPIIPPRQRAGHGNPLGMVDAVFAAEIETGAALLAGIWNARFANVNGGIVPMMLLGNEEIWEGGVDNTAAADRLAVLINATGEKGYSLHLELSPDDAPYGVVLAHTYEEDMVVSVGLGSGAIDMGRMHEDFVRGETPPRNFERIVGSSWVVAALAAMGPYAESVSIVAPRQQDIGYLSMVSLMALVPEGTINLFIKESERIPHSLKFLARTMKLLITETVLEAEEAVFLPRGRFAPGSRVRHVSIGFAPFGGSEIGLLPQNAGLLPGGALPPNAIGALCSFLPASATVIPFPVRTI